MTVLNLSFRQKILLGAGAFIFLCAFILLLEWRFRRQEPPREGPALARPDYQARIAAAVSDAVSAYLTGE